MEKWGCDFAKDQKTDPELKTFLEQFETVTPLEPRDAFFGGRTGVATLYAKAEEGEDIAYVDFTSLYPSINKYGTYPVGFPPSCTDQKTKIFLIILESLRLISSLLSSYTTPCCLSGRAENLLFLSVDPVSQTSCRNLCWREPTCAVTAERNVC